MSRDIDIATEARRRARNKFRAPKGGAHDMGTRVIQDKRKKPPKHRKPLRDQY